MNLLLLSIILLATINDVVNAQDIAQPCTSDAATDGIRTIFFNIFEASQQDLQLNPDNYLMDTKINGNLTTTDSNDPNEVLMQILPSTGTQNIAFDPAELFRLESRPLNTSEFGYRTRTFLRLTQPLDRDGVTASPSDDLNVIEFRILCQSAVSPGSSSTTFVIRVNIQDVNDNSPILSNSTYSISVSEAMPVGTIVLTFSGTDKDMGSNGAISYSIIGSQSNKFSIPSSSSGRLVISSVLDYEEMKQQNQFNYPFTILATDGGNIKRSATAGLLVTITDADDQGPAFIYQGCVTVDGGCLHPSYTTQLPTANTPIRLQLRPSQNQNALTDLVVRDQDTFNAPISLTLEETIPSGYQDYFFIETLEGNTFTRAFVMQSQTLPVKDLQRLTLVIKATELTGNKHFNRAIIDALFSNRSCDNIANEPCPSITPIVGGVLGSLLFLVIVILVIVLVILWRQRRTDEVTIDEPLKPQLYLKTC